ncbi:MAG: YdcF family protein [Acidobacteria bacterium]|nr:YdcF family protein [Acidobacteriota bacterium]
MLTFEFMPLSSPGIGRRLRIFCVAGCALALLCATLALISLFYAGRLLYVQDPLGRANAIYVLAGSRADRWLEAADLFKSGYADQIILTAGSMDRAEALLRGRGIFVPTEAEAARNALLQLSIPTSAIKVVPRRHATTVQEARSLRDVVISSGLGSVIVVTSAYHTRRARYIVHRELEGTRTRIIIRASRYDEYDAEQWWRRPTDARATLIELAQLALCAVGLGQ